MQPFEFVVGEGLMLQLLLALAFGVLGGILIRGIFAIISLRQNSLNPPIGYVNVPLIYMSVSEFLSQSAGKRWLQYLLFRTIPVLVSFIFVAGLNQSIDNDIGLRSLSFVMLLITFYVPDLVLKIKDRHEPAYTSVRLLRVLLVVINILIGIAVFASTLRIDFSCVIPRFEGIRDNLWSTLLAAIIVAWFIQFTNMRPPLSHQEVKWNEWASFIMQQGEVISHKYGSILQQVSEKNNINSIIMEAILVYENLNRPSMIRHVENCLVGFMPFTMTVGIAQVSSDRKLSDEESIDIMGQILGSTAESLDESLPPYLWLSKLLEAYNDETYAENVMKILEVLHPDWSQEYSNVMTDWID